MDDDPLKIATAKRIARKTLRIVHQNIWFAIGIKVLVLLLGAVGLTNMCGACLISGVASAATTTSPVTEETKKEEALNTEEGKTEEAQQEVKAQ